MTVVYVVLRVSRGAKIRYLLQKQKNACRNREKNNNKETAIRNYFVPLPGNPGLGRLRPGNSNKFVIAPGLYYLCRDI